MVIFLNIMDKKKYLGRKGDERRKKEKEGGRRKKGEETRSTLLTSSNMTMYASDGFKLLMLIGPKRHLLPSQIGSYLFGPAGRFYHLT